MPRTYIRKTPSKDLKVLDDAVEAVKRDYMSIREAAKVYKVDKSTLARHISKGPLEIPKGGQL